MQIYFGSLGTTLLAQNNTSATPNQKSLEQPWWLTAGAATSELLFQMNNLGITDATPLQPHSYTDVSRRGTEESVNANLGDLAAIRLEPEHVGASASNHEVKDEYSIWCIKAILCCLRVRNALLY